MEARTASNISHENIISVFDFGEDQGRPFIVMEFLEGESLRDAIKNGHRDFNRRLKIGAAGGARASTTSTAARSSTAISSRKTSTSMRRAK